MSVCVCVSTYIDLNLYWNGANDRDRASLIARELNAKYNRKKTISKKKRIQLECFVSERTQILRMFIFNWEFVLISGVRKREKYIVFFLHIIPIFLRHSKKKHNSIKYWLNRTPDRSQSLWLWYIYFFHSVFSVSAFLSLIFLFFFWYSTFFLSLSFGRISIQSHLFGREFAIS